MAAPPQEDDLLRPEGDRHRDAGGLPWRGGHVEPPPNEFHPLPHARKPPPFVLRLLQRRRNSTATTGPASSRA